MSDRVAVMHHGRVLQTGAPQEIYGAPASLFVAEFVGLSNRLDGRIVAVDGTRCRIEAPGLPAIQADAPAGAGPGNPVAVVLRPERLRLSQPSASNGFDNVVPARVARAVYNGHEMQYQLHVTERLSWTVRIQQADGGQKRFLPGEAVAVRWNRDDGVVLVR